MQLRPYQTKLIDDIEANLQVHKSVLAQLPTGGGKTVVFIELIRRAVVEQKKRVLLIVHRKELIRQAEEKLFRLRTISYGFIMAGAEQNYSRPVQLASIQTLVRRRMPMNIDLIITDEAHHATAPSYRSVYDACPNAKRLGFTATPCRTNGMGFNDNYDTLVCGPSVNELIDLGFLTKPRVLAAPLRTDLSAVRKTAGDYNDAYLDAIMNNEAMCGDVVNEWKKHAAGKKTVVFAVSIAHSKNIVERYNAAGVRAAHVDGGTPQEERDRILRDFASGEYLILSNVGIVTEGFDVPAIECVQLVRPTLSLALYLQMVGRGLRTYGDKTEALILDHANCVFTHGFPQKDRKWKLYGVVPKKKNEDQGTTTTAVFAKDKTGRLFRPNEIPQEMTDFELVEVEYNDDRISELTSLARVAKRKGYKPMWAYFRFVEKYKKPSLYELQYMQQMLRPSPGWLTRVKSNFGY